MTPGWFDIMETGAPDLGLATRKCVVLEKSVDDPDLTAIWQSHICEDGSNTLAWFVSSVCEELLKFFCCTRIPHFGKFRNRVTQPLLFAFGPLLFSLSESQILGRNIWDSPKCMSFIVKPELVGHFYAVVVLVWDTRVLPRVVVWVPSLVSVTAFWLSLTRFWASSLSAS